jgi:hypothetical protein
MTHLTGPREKFVRRLKVAIAQDIVASGVTISEAFEAMHEAQIDLVRIMLRPWEDETCPTCPRDMKKRGARILAARRRR